MGRPRHRLRLWAMATFGVVFTLIGLAELVLGRGTDQRLTGLMLVLLCGVGATGYLGGPLLTRRGRGTIELGRAGAEPAFPHDRRHGRHRRQGPRRQSSSRAGWR